MTPSIETPQKAMSVPVPAAQKCPLPPGGIGAANENATLTLLSRMHLSPAAGGQTALTSAAPFAQYHPEIYYGISSLWAGDVPVAMRGVTLLYGGNPVGTLSFGPKQYVLLGKKLIIFPDRVYLDLTQNPPILCDMGPDVPAMDYVTVAGDRLFGCKSTTGMIYASKAGDPTVFTPPANPVAASPWRASSPTPGAFTACCTQGSCVLFFKENAIIKLMGSAAAGAGSFSLYEYSMPGVAAGAHASLCVSGNTAYYAGTAGLYAYSGAEPRRIDGAVAGLETTAGFSGKAGFVLPDGKYWIAGQGSDGARHLLIYDPSSGAFSRHDGENVTSFARCGTNLLMLCADGYVYTPGTGETSFFAQWQMAVDKTTLRPRRLLQVIARVDGTAGTALSLSRKRGETWVSSSPVLLPGGEMTVIFPLPPTDVFTPQIRICGVGRCRIYLATVRIT